MDVFDSAECRKLAGRQSIGIGLGGALLSISSGFLINYLWYGGYIVLSIGLPVGIFALFTLPRGNSPEHKKTAVQEQKAKLDPDVYFYAAAIAMLLFLFSVGTGNLSVHLAAAGIENFSVAAGFGSAVQMLGSAVFGFFFTPLSKRFGDYLIPAAFLMITLGLLILSLCTFSLILMFLGIAIIGMSMSTLNPQCVLSVSKRVNVHTSATGTSLINSVAPGIGTFLSPVIITNVTFSLAGDNTIFRYCFTAFLSLATAAAFFFLCRYRAKR